MLPFRRSLCTNISAKIPPPRRFLATAASSARAPVAPTPPPAHPAENRDTDYRVNAFSDSGFLQKQLLQTKTIADQDRDKNSAVADRLQTVLRCYEEMDGAASAMTGGSAAAWSHHPNVPQLRYQPHHPLIGDMKRYVSDEEQTNWTEQIAKATLNLEKYPLDRLDSGEGEKLIHHIAQQLQADKTCFLGEFLRPEAVEASAGLFDALHEMGKTHFSRRWEDYTEENQHYTVSL